MRYIDISETITAGMKRYHSDPDVMITRFKSLKTGGSCNLAKLEFGSHTGTHIDAPKHIFEKGKTVDKIAVKFFFRNVMVTDIKGISKNGFFEKMRVKRADGILFKCEKARTGLTLGDARILVNKKIRLAGIDRMSIEEAPDKKHPVHKLLSGRGIIIIECLNLKNARHGFYKLICLPLKIKNGDGAPARAVLIKECLNQ